MSTWMIFRTMNWQHNDSAEHSLADPLTSWKSQHNFLLGRFQHFRGDQACAVLGKISTEQASYVEKRAAAANQTLIMGAVADNITLGAQNSILQRDRIESPPLLGNAFNTQILHHRTSPRTLVNST